MALSLLISLFWSYWGVLENFHEGWYEKSLLGNIGMMLGQYLLWPILFMSLSCLAIRLPKVGAGLFVAVGLGINWFLFHFDNAVALELFLIPCLVLATLYYFAAFPRPGLWMALVVGPPILLIVAVGWAFEFKVAHRITSSSNQALSWSAGGRMLVWAPPGPGWPDKGVSYRQAVERCRHLDKDGRHLSDKPLNIWRLPTVQEAVFSLDRAGRPAGCTYSGSPGKQPCDYEPDKEPPLWNPYSMVIYWWTGTDAGPGQNLRVSYNGFVIPIPKTSVTGYTGFRAVRQLSGS